MHTAAVKRLIALLFLFLFFSLPACTAEKNSFTGFAMGSVITADIYADRKAAEKIWQMADAEANRIDSLLSGTDASSEISVLNRSGSAACSAQTLDILRRSLEIGALSDGCLDLTVGAVTALWGFAGENPSLPAAKDIASALQTVGADHVAIDDRSGVATLSEGTQLDLGAVGKGAGADAMLDVLKKNASPAVINFGGTVLLYGRPAGRQSWTVGLRDPYGDANSYFATLTCTPGTNDGAVILSTSGSYEKQFVFEGKSYHHILDPATGYPVETALSGVTVVSSEGLLSDALSTACFVSGLNDSSLTLLQNADAQAVFVFADKSVYVTDGLADSFRITDRDFHLIAYEERP